MIIWPMSGPTQSWMRSRTWISQVRHGRGTCIAKVLGVAAILVPGLRMLKEWAYGGLVFDLTAAADSHAKSQSRLVLVMVLACQSPDQAQEKSPGECERTLNALSDIASWLPKTMESSCPKLRYR
jgi:hypothetical protein